MSAYAHTVWIVSDALTTLIDKKTNKTVVQLLYRDYEGLHVNL